MTARALTMGAVLAFLPVMGAAQDLPDWMPADTGDWCDDSVAFDPDAAISTAVIDEVGTEATFFDTLTLTCAGDTVPIMCGSGGCTLFAEVGGAVTEWQAQGWQMIDVAGRPLLLIERDGGWCGGAGSQVCYEALNWDEDAGWLTVMPPG
ncbi:hypothetical protein [Pelagovum pacificum]|uniref:Alkaline proteinase inhibitor/ Outer membrane lipoprotein Omp19 domain-containing protein n=1 Tax=Pelagovum pacificum TaxID=2588711 RepID=A0A5C5GIB1_9RHOB|nr:hypothetical protein [Pelagovum pacificum]QQA42599.1 hypothetical protein I8N54_17745 [Pelagovum pacificum]TNY34250.1 hypothetical protein FHY64_13645 [Pelagovum pacificum]